MKIKITDIAHYEKHAGLHYAIDFPKIGCVVEYGSESLFSGWCFVSHPDACSSDVEISFSNELLEKKIYLTEDRLDVKKFLTEKKTFTYVDSFGYFGFCYPVKLGIKNEVTVSVSGESYLKESFFSTICNSIDIIIGHSSSGKSAVLNEMHLDRWLYDADVYFAKSRKEKTIENLSGWLSYPRKHGFVVLCNDYELLKHISRLKDSFFNIRFIYVRRPFEIYQKNIMAINTDGNYHSIKDPTKLKLQYDRFHRLYESLADCEVFYDGYDLSELRKAICGVLGDKNVV